MLPPIRYPLPTLLGLILASLLFWTGAELSKGWRAELSERLRLAVEGPPVPNSPRSAIFAGSIAKRGLLLLDQTPATNRPNGSTVETIDRRMFVEVYDTWPSPGPITHVRVGNRKPIGWVPLVGVLPWNTRLVIQAPEGRLNLAETSTGTPKDVEVGRTSLPVLGWTDEAVEVALWDPTQPWSKVSRTGWVQSKELPAGAWGVWISQVELPILLSLANQGEDPLTARLRAVMGRLAENRVWPAGDVEALRKALPSLVFQGEPGSKVAAGKLAEANAQTAGEAGWSGLSFRFLPLGDLP